jgi:spoIIIJ-associated protein
MKSLAFEGKTIDEAIEKACDEFQVSREKLNIEIISEGTTGFLGLVGGKKAKIKACLISLDEALATPLKEHFPSEQPPADSPDEPSQAPSSNQEADDPPPLPPFGKGELGGFSSENLVGRGKRILEGILFRMHIDSLVNVSETPDKVILNIEGDEGGLIIGKGGQNLDALQYIVNKAAHKSGNSRKVIIVDTEYYRKRREESLVAMAEKISEKVKKTKKAVVLNHFNAHNRRIIHMALQNDASITTKSGGEGEYKKIIILPVKKE